MSHARTPLTGRWMPSVQRVSARLASYRRRIRSPLPSSAGFTVSINTLGASTVKALNGAQPPLATTIGTLRS